MIEFTSRPGCRLGRGDHVIKSPSGVGRTALGVRVRRVVGYLILESDHIVIALLRAPVCAMLERTLHARFESFVRLPRQYEQVILNTILHAAVPGARDA